MAQKATTSHIVRTKIDLVQSQAKELQELLDSLIKKEVAAANVVESGKHDMNTVRVINSRLDALLEFLLEKCTEIDNLASRSVADCKNQQPTFPDISRGSDILKPFGATDGTELAILTFRENKEENETKFHGIEERLDNYSTEFCRKLKKNHSKLIKYVDNRTSGVEKSIESIEVQLQHLVNRNSSLSEGGVCAVRDLIKQIEVECIDIKNSVQKNEKEATNLRKTTEVLASQLDTFKSQIAYFMTSLGDLSSKVNDSAECQINEKNQTSKLQDRIQVIEEHRSEDLDYCKGKLDELESLYKQLCQMVASQVKPLLHLKDILSKYHQTIELQEEAASQTSTVSADISDHTLGPDRLESKRQRVPVGFTAYWGDYNHVPADATLIFTDVLCNEGNCYNITTGHFTAPYDGLYLTSLTLRQKDGGKVCTEVRLARSRHFVVKPERTVCKSLTSVENASYCDTGVVWMKAGDSLHVRVVEVECKPRLSLYSSFSCILVG